MFVERSFVETGVYDTHPYYGISQDICRACPGLFGEGVRSQTALIETFEDAEEFWWDNAIGASSRKCNGVGVCNFYAEDREKDVHFMGNAKSFFTEAQHRTCNESSIGYSSYVDDQGISIRIDTVQACAFFSAQQNTDWFGYFESYFGQRPPTYNRTRDNLSEP